MRLKTLKVRVKDKHKKELNRQARSVNYVWNYINEISSRAIKERHIYMSAYDIHPYTKGSAKELGLHSQSVQCIASEYVTRRKQFKKVSLRWRKSMGASKALGWIPVNSRAAKFKNGCIFFNGKYFGIWDSFGMSKFSFRAGSFNEDARGRWYFNVVVEVDNHLSKGDQIIGVDLGCKVAATASNGDMMDKQEYRSLQDDLRKAQRAGNKKRLRNIHAKIANRRKDNIHKFTRRLVDSSRAIFVGNINSKQMLKTHLAKSVSDAAWGKIKSTLEYKCAYAGVVFDVIDEAFSTQTCSNCGEIPDNSPKGRTGLGMRQWKCASCDSQNDRDINAALNIAAAGHRRLAEGILSLKRGIDVNAPFLRIQ
ncbi:RNA-guided endonuclease InsQ/TnpB family protein [Alteromonas facilis]|uniref:RNA-guided endonuclease InsQ/TnpB family protein n=1 Tax=Alteromonas facilis TaxID=2048004 RepID=UPI000C2928DD|nr:RNA-guided endonuclease TnpB family protein [Alteromonas facilis]